MGLFDYVRCRYPLPIEGAEAMEFQTKDTDWPYMEQYEIREDGTLWRQEYDTEDRSDPNAKGILRLAGMATRVNERWVRCDMTGELRFYGAWDKQLETRVEFSAYFVKGELKHMEPISLPEPEPIATATHAGALEATDFAVLGPQVSTRGGA